MRVDIFLDQGLRTLLAKYLKDYPEPDEMCGHKGQKTTFDVNFVSQKITASNLRLRLDDIQALLPAFSPILASAGYVSIEFSLALSRPLKIRIKDVFLLLRANPRSAQEHSPEELREVINSRVLTYCLLRGEIIANDEGIHHPSPDIGLKPEAIEKLQQLLQQSEIWIERLHIRIEDSGVSASPPLNLPEEPGKGFAAGLTVDSIRLQGDDFHSMTKFMAKVRLVGAPDPPPLPTSMMDIQELSALDTTPPNSSSSQRQQDTTCLRVCKVGMFKGIKVYCHGVSYNDLYSYKKDGKGVPPSDSDLQQLMGLIFSPTTTIEMEHPLLRLDTATFCAGLTLSREVLGLITSAYLHVVLSTLHINLSSTVLGRVLRWIALKNRHSEALLYTCTRPVKVNGMQRRRIVCLWQLALRSILRQVRVRFAAGGHASPPVGGASVEKFHEMKKDMTKLKQDKNDGDFRSHEIKAIPTKRPSRKWRMWFKQWIVASRYIHIRDLLHAHTKLGSVLLDSTTNGQQHHLRYREILQLGNGQVIRATALPWMTPKPELDASEALLKKLVIHHPLRPLPPSSLSPSILLALWALKLDMELWSPLKTISGALALYKSRASWLGKMRRRERIRTEKSCKLWRSLSREINPERTNRNKGGGDNEDEQQDVNYMVDRVGTLLLCPIQATGLKALAQQVPWKVIVTLTLEEANVAPEEFEQVTLDSAVAYNSKSKSCQWVSEHGDDAILDFHVELGEEQARQLEISQRKCISMRQKLGTVTTGLLFSPSDGIKKRQQHGGLPSLIQDSEQPFEPDSFPSSFLLTATITAKSRILGNTIDLGSATLPGGILTAKRGQVCEHRCKLIGKRQARKGLAVLSDQVELVLLSTFVPPGDDVAKEEQSLRLASQRRAGKWGISDPTTAMFSDSGGSESRVLDNVSDLLTDAAHGVKTVAQIAKESKAPLWVSVLPQRLFITSHISEVSISVHATLPDEHMKRTEVKSNNNSTTSSCNGVVVDLPGVPLLEFNARLIKGMMEIDLINDASCQFSLQMNNSCIVDHQAPVHDQSLLHVGPIKASVEATAKSWYTPPGGYAFLHMDNWDVDNVITSVSLRLGAYSINWSPQSIVSACHNVWRSTGRSTIATVSQSCLVGSTSQTGDAWITVQGCDGREVSISASFGKFNIAMKATQHYRQQLPSSLVSSKNKDELNQRIIDLERQLMVMRAASASRSAGISNDSRGGEGRE